MPVISCATNTSDMDAQPEGVWRLVVEAAVARSSCVGYECRSEIVFHRAGWGVVEHIDPETITVRDSPQRLISAETIQRTERGILVLAVAHWLSRFHSDPALDGLDSTTGADLRDFARSAVASSVAAPVPVGAEDDVSRHWGE